jgi:Xaa-Pro aminopeptidase
MKTPALICLFLSLFFQAAISQTSVLPLKEQAEVRDHLLEKRITSVLPELMKRTGIDLWVIAGREYNEDPVLKTMLPATWISARRRTVLILRYSSTDNSVEALAVARYDIGTVFKKAWDPEKQPDQWARVAEIISERDPKTIGINVSVMEALSDGLTKSEYDGLMKALAPKFRKRITNAGKLSTGWLETRTPEEMAYYKIAARLTHEIIQEAFSPVAITPGITTTDDVVWFMRERAQQRGLPVWFHPTVDLQRDEKIRNEYAFSSRPGTERILPGDLLHCDFGISYLGMHTDIQRLAYVCKPGETDAPDYLKKALLAGNEAQDLLTTQFITGKTGNEILRAALEAGAKVGNKLTIYTHPVGFHGHAAGTTIGMWDNQKHVPGSGDYPLFPNTAYAIELNTRVFIPEWNREIRVMLEENAFFDGKQVSYINGRQTSLYIIPSKD